MDTLLESPHCANGHSLELIEQSVIGCLLQEPENAKDRFPRLPRYFISDPRLRTCHGVIGELLREGILPDPVSVAQRLKEKGEMAASEDWIFIGSLPDKCETPLSFESHLRQLEPVAKQRRMREAHQRLGGLIESGQAKLEDFEVLIAGIKNLSGPAPDALPPIIAIDALLACETPLPSEIVHGVLHQGSKLALGGGSKTFKTWTLLDLALAVSSGEPWLSLKTTKGRVLYLNFEIQPAFFQRRIKAIADEKNIRLTPGSLDFWNLRGHAASYDRILPMVTERTKSQGYALIILDPVYKIYGQTDENSARDTARLLNALELLASETGAAIAFGAHYSKGNQSSKEAIDRISGSGVFARDPDAILNFTRHEEQDAFTVEATLRNCKPIEPFVVRWQYPLMRRDDSLDPRKLKQASGRPKLYTVDKLLECLKGHRLTSQNWLKKASPEIGISKTRFFALLEEAKLHPELKQTPEGQWFYDDTANQSR